MSRVSYFQRFSQAENHATNNTLLLFRYFYEASPFRLQKLLTSMLDVDLAVGLTFEQQVRMGQGIPDALITQEPLRILSRLNGVVTLMPRRYGGTARVSQLPGTEGVTSW